MSSFSSPPQKPKRPSPVKIPNIFSDQQGDTNPLLTPTNLDLYRNTVVGVNPCFSVLSYNVWMSPINQILRHANLITLLLKRSSNVIMLQEVKPFLANAFREVMGDKYYVSPFDYCYGNLTLIKKQFLNSETISSSQIKFEEIELTTNMGRSLLLTTVNLNEEIYVFGNMHFESLNNTETRKIQLNEVKEAMEGEERRLVLLGGDFNFDDIQTWGDWKTESFWGSDNPPSLPKKSNSNPSTEPKLENINLSEIFTDYIDPWLHLNKDTTPESRFTFDGELNSNVKDDKEQMRYDRFLIKEGVDTAQDVRILREAVSDHFGLEVVFEFGGEGK